MFRFVLLLFVVLLAYADLRAADDPPPRNGDVVDSSGAKTAITDLAFHDANLGRFEGGHDCIALFLNVKGTGLEIKIPSATVISITFDGGVAEVKYRSHGNDATLKGQWAAKGVFTGKNDGKYFQLADGKVKSVTFTTPAANNDAPPPTFDGTLVLNDGSTVKIGGLERQGTFKARMQMYYSHFGDFCYVIAGESNTTTTKLADIASIEFGNNDDVTVTLKSGAKTTGKVATNGNDACFGFTGVCDLGGFHVNRTEVKRIQFGS